MPAQSEHVTFMGSVAIETDNLMTACKVIANIEGSKARGLVKIGDRFIRWSTLQQYNFHKGFTH